ncbi:MAG: hypothetical protein QXL67_04970 [Candidatus Bathyarchaeia archaeon]
MKSLKAGLDMDLTFWLQSLAIIVFGTLGSLLFKLGVNEFGEINPLSITCWLRLVFTPAIFFGLVCLWLSRLLFSLPLSKIGVGKFSAFIIPLNVIAIVIASIIVFGEQFKTREIIGIVLGLIGIILIGSG